jgi:hypothetical protein
MSLGAPGRASATPAAQRQYQYHSERATTVPNPLIVTNSSFNIML